MNGHNENKEKLHKSIDSPIGDKIEAFGKFYLFLVIICGVICCGAIVLAVYVHVAVGIAVGVVAAVLYRYALDDTLKRTFGLAYRRVEGGIAVAPVKRGKDKCPRELYIPERLMWLDVVGVYAVEKIEKKGETRYAEIYLPATVKSVEEGCFSSFGRLEYLFFDGERSVWEQVEGGAELPVICKGETVETFEEIFAAPNGEAAAETEADTLAESVEEADVTKETDAEETEE